MNANLPDDERYMRMALAEAKQAFEKGEVPVGCVIVANGQIVGRGHNLTETLADVTAHAEIQAITAAANTLGGKYLTQCSLYVTIEPCTMCAGAIGWAQIKRVIYGASDPKAGSCGSLTNLFEMPYNHKPEVVSGVLEKECSEILSRFFARLREKRKKENPSD